MNRQPTGEAGSAGIWVILKNPEEGETESMPSDDLGGAPGPVRRRQDVASDIALTPLYRRLSELGAWSRLNTVIRMGPRGRSGEFTTHDPDGLLRGLMATGGFCTDTKAGRILHHGAISVRERSSTESLHVALYERGQRVTVHLDRRSPLATRSMPADSCHYSWPRVVAHVAGRLGAKLTRRISGGWKRLDIECALAREQRIAADGDQGRSVR